MKVKFTKRRLYTNAILAALWVVIGLLHIQEDDSLRTTDYGYFVIGLLYLAHFLFDSRTQYLTLSQGVLRKNILYGFAKSIKLEEVVEIKSSDNGYRLITEESSLKINTRWIEEASLAALTQRLQQLPLPAHRTPFTSLG